MLLQLFGVAWVMPQRLSELLANWRGQLGNCNALKIWRLKPLCLIWRLWRSGTQGNLKIVKMDCKR